MLMYVNASIQICDNGLKPNSGSLGLFTTPTPLPNPHTSLLCPPPPPLLSGPTSKQLGNSKLSQRHSIELVFLLRFDLSLDSLRLIFRFL